MQTCLILLCLEICQLLSAILNATQAVQVSQDELFPLFRQPVSVFTDTLQSLALYMAEVTQVVILCQHHVTSSNTPPTELINIIYKLLKPVDISCFNNFVS